MTNNFGQHKLLGTYCPRQNKEFRLRECASSRSVFYCMGNHVSFFTHKNFLLRRFVASRLLFLFRVRPLKTKCRLRRNIV